MGKVGVKNISDETERVVNIFKTIWPRGYKTFSMLNSTEHEISNAHKFKYISFFFWLR